MMKKLRYGFTLTEVLTVLVVIVAITIIALGITVKQDKLREKQIEAMTKSFYSNVESAYGQILSYNAANNEIMAIEDKNKDGKKDGKDLRELFNLYMDGEDVDCSKMGINVNIDSVPASYLKSAVCSEHSGKVIAGYFLNTACNSNITAKDVYTKGSTTSGSVTNSCGYVIYGNKRSKGNLGVDVFIIPLGKKGLMH